MSETAPAVRLRVREVPNLSPLSLVENTLWVNGKDMEISVILAILAQSEKYPTWHLNLNNAKTTPSYSIKY